MSWLHFLREIISKPVEPTFCIFADENLRVLMQQENLLTKHTVKLLEKYSLKKNM